MGTPLQNQHRRVLDALAEGEVTAVITLYKKGLLGRDPAKSDRENIKSFLVNKDALEMREDEAIYWLDFFNI